MGIATMQPAEAPSDADCAKIFDAGVTTVRIDGLAAKPHLNGKLGVVVKGVNESGRVGVRPEGQKDSLLLSTSKLEPLPAFDRLGVSVRQSTQENAQARARCSAAKGCTRRDAADAQPLARITPPTAFV